MYAQQALRAIRVLKSGQPLLRSATPCSLAAVQDRGVRRKLHHETVSIADSPVAADAILPVPGAPAMTPMLTQKAWNAIERSGFVGMTSSMLLQQPHDALSAVCEGLLVRLYCIVADEHFNISVFASGKFASVAVSSGTAGLCIV